MKRQAIKELQRWKASPRRKPLIVSGARQVGKTWLMKEFGNTCFERFAYVTFDDNPQLVAAFGGSLSPQRLLPILQAEAGVRIDGSTLLILDEIQESPRAIQSLKYFNEQMPHLPVVAGGSALGLALRRGKRAQEKGRPRPSFPVGKVSFLDLYPLNFSEFLGGIGEELLVELVETLDWEAIAPFHDRLIELLKQYLFVGGMPEAVLAFAELAYRMDCLWDEWLKAGHDLVFTIGVVHTAPTSAIAIVPGEVTFCSDIRSLSQETLDGFHALFEEEARKIGEKRGVKFEFDGVIKSQPLAIHKELSEHLAKSATEAGLKVKKLPSGAGHDTVIFGNLGIPAAMIFVANQKGSHNPNEAMEITDFIQGAEALWHAVKAFPVEGVR